MCSVVWLVAWCLVCACVQQVLGQAQTLVDGGYFTTAGGVAFANENGIDSSVWALAATSEVCPTGWTGALCDQCTAGFGANCENLCSICKIHGTCNPGLNGYCTCDYNTGWSGPLCDVCIPARVNASAWVSTLVAQTGIPRWNGQAVTLLDDSVFVIGSSNPAGKRTPQRYLPIENIWQLLPDSSDYREAACTVVLQNGNVFVAGGYDDGTYGYRGVPTAQIFNTTSLSWSKAYQMVHGRYDFACVTLTNDEVLLVGGSSGRSTPLQSVEMFDPASLTFKSVSSLNIARGYPGILFVGNSSVIVSGGCAVFFPLGGCAGPYLDSVELYDIVTDSWTLLKPMSVPRLGHIMVFFGQSSVIVAGGTGPNGDLGSSEVYDLATGSWSVVESVWSVPRSNPTAATFKNGAILVAGGASNGQSVGNVDMFSYDDQQGAFTWVPTVSLQSARSSIMSALLSNQTWILVGGMGRSGPSSIVEAYTYKGHLLSAACQGNVNENVPVCSSSNCLNGYCANGQCACTPGWAGKSCSVCAGGYWGPNCTACSSCVNGVCYEGEHGSCTCNRGWTGSECDTCIFSTDAYDDIMMGYLMTATTAPSWEADCAAMDGAMLRLGWQVATLEGSVCCVQRGSYDEVQNACHIGCQPPLDYIVYQSKCYSRCFNSLTDVCVSGLLAFSSGQGAC
jgi:hypothetical protein